jgi:hypothetical protein
VADSGCIYGPTGSFKTSQIKWLSRYIYEKTGKSTLLLSCDGGGWRACEDEVAGGIIIPYRVESATLPLVILRKISQGYWPEDPEETKPEKINLIPMNFEKIGAIGVEGWTSIGNMIMRYLPDKGVNVGGENRQKPGANLTFTLPIHVMGVQITEEFGSNTRGDFGFVQNTEYGLVMNFNSLPVKYVLYTALESKTEDDDKSTVYGPAMPGKKATAQCGSWVGDLIHASDMVAPKQVIVDDPKNPGQRIETTVFDTVVRMYFKRHLDPVTYMPFPAKPRVTPTQIPELDRRLPGGYFEPTTEWGFDRYLHTLDELGTKGQESLAEWRRKMDEKLGRKGGPDAGVSQ